MERITEQTEAPEAFGAGDMSDAAERASVSEAENQAFVGQTLSTVEDADALLADRDDESLVVIPRPATPADAKGIPVTAEVEDPDADDPSTAVHAGALAVRGDVITGTEREPVAGDADETDEGATDAVTEAVDEDGKSETTAEDKQDKRLLTPAQEKEFNRMYGQYRGLLAHWALEWGVRDADVEDAIQDIFLSVARNGKLLDPEAGHNEKAYLRQAANNMFINGYRKNQRRVPLTESPEANEVGLALAEDPAQLVEDGVIEDEETIQRLTEWKALMPAEMFDALLKAEVGDWSYKQVAASQGVPIGTVMSRLNRAKKYIRAHEASKNGQDLSA